MQASLHTFKAKYKCKYSPKNFIHKINDTDNKNYLNLFSLNFLTFKFRFRLLNLQHLLTLIDLLQILISLILLSKLIELIKLSAIERDRQ